MPAGGVGKDAISKFNIGYAPPYSDEHHQGRALVDGFLPRFEKNIETFNAFTDAGLARLLNDNSVNGYGYYCRLIDFRRKYPFSRNYGDSLAGRIVFPIHDADAGTTDLVGRCPGDKGVRWLKKQTREAPLSDKGWLYGIEKAAQYIRQYRTIILVEGLFDYFAFYNLLQDQGKPVVVSTLGSYFTPEAAAILKGLDIEHFHCRLRLGRTRQKRHRTDGRQIKWVGLLPRRSGEKSGPLRCAEAGGQSHQRVFPGNNRWPVRPVAIGVKNRCG